MNTPPPLSNHNIHLYRRKQVGLTFRVEEFGISGRTSITTLTSVSRYALLAITSHHLVVACEITYWSHRLDAQNAQSLVIRHIQLAVEWRHGHEVLVRRISCPVSTTSQHSVRGVATAGILVYIPPTSVTVLFTCGTLTHVLNCIIIIISGFGIYGAAVVQDSGVGNTWQRLTLVLHEFLSNGLTPSRLHIVISFLTHADHVFLGLPRSLVPGSPKRSSGDTCTD